VAKFDADEYSRFRVSYPKVLFDGLRSFCGQSLTGKPLKVLDLGSGTGFSSRAFLAFFPHAEFTLVEPDRAMLEASEASFQNDSHILHSNPLVRFVHSSAEEFQLTESYDLVLIGSAWHWMDRAALLKNFERARVKSVFIFEYQFPKAKSDTAINEWVRREFNLRWRTQSQAPRGTLRELTSGLRESNEFSETSRIQILHEVNFDLDSFMGMITSQSRYLAFESTLPAVTRDAYRQSLRAELSAFWSLQTEMPFLLPYEGYAFSLRSP
jgi:SAM-dependent methyltransferase